MRKFIIRYLITYLLYALFHILNLLISGDTNLSSLALFLFWFLIIANFISTGIFYILMPYISNTIRLSLLLVTPVLFLFLIVSKTVFHVSEENLKIPGGILFFSVLPVPQLLLPDFNAKQHRLDDKTNVNYLLPILFSLFFILWYIALKAARE